MEVNSVSPLLKQKRILCGEHGSVPVCQSPIKERCVQPLAWQCKCPIDCCAKAGHFLQAFMPSVESFIPLLAFIHLQDASLHLYGGEINGDPLGPYAVAALHWQRPSDGEQHCVVSPDKPEQNDHRRKHSSVQAWCIQWLTRIILYEDEWQHKK